MLFSGKGSRKNISTGKIGLALGGGAALGGFHIGVLKAIDELNIPIHVISGTSIGAFIATLFAFGKGWQEIRDLALDLNWFNISKVTLSQFGLLSNEKLGEIIKNSFGNVTFEQSEIQLAVVATDLAAGKKVVLSEGEVIPAVLASACLPGVFKPVELDKMMLVDGGLLENVPVSPLKEMGAKTIIAVDLMASAMRHTPKNIIEVLTKSYSLVFVSSTKIKLDDADIMISPDLSDFNLIDTKQTRKLLDVGYRSARSALTEEDR
jgi:NTE family protein